jgi:hypothetical protein
MNGVMMVLLRGRMLLIGLAAFLAGWPPAARPAGSVLENLTGLPASETDLANDGRYNYRPRLTGIKLALGIDYVAVYRTSNEETTIELHRCNWNH